MISHLDVRTEVIPRRSLELEAIYSLLDFVE